MHEAESDSTAQRVQLTEIARQIWRGSEKRHLVPITGTSMRPLLRPGDHVWVEHGGRRIRRGDVIVFLQGDRLVAHRVLAYHVKADSWGFLTKGDRSPQFDLPVQESCIFGRVVAVQRGNRTLSLDSSFLCVAGWLVVWGSLLRLRARSWAQKVRRAFGGRPNPTE
ncbi:MAG: hypothetical protein A2Y73_05210 [Chloroflexi bacterium RBG_13_56_8]|nr:MAG: hypothetical protein A2Y73_05210 [Chloroflexi bacterium RBG_13_56_8]